MYIHLYIYTYTGQVCNQENENVKYLIPVMFKAIRFLGKKGNITYILVVYYDRKMQCIRLFQQHNKTI